LLRKIFLPTILLVLAYGFWVSPHVKMIAAGVAIFLFGMLSLEEGFRAFTGGTLERMLRRTTSSTGKYVRSTIGSGYRSELLFATLRRCSLAIVACWTKANLHRLVHRQA